MEFRKMVTITLYARQQKRHRCIEQSFGLCGRGRGWDNLGEWHWNMYNIINETSRQSRFNAQCRMLGAGALGWPRGIKWGGRWAGGSGWGTRVRSWWIHVDVWQNQYNTLKHVKYHVWNELPVQVRCTILDTSGWCTGTTQRDGMGREAGGGFRMRNTCIPVVDSFRYLAKPIQYCKV